MEYVGQITQFIDSEHFFDYHGLVLTILWIVASSLAIVAKRLSYQLHGSLFFVIDVLTLYFVTGAWVRVYPDIGNYDQWTIIKKLHIIGGTVFAAVLIFEHLLGVYTLYISRKYAGTHHKLAWFVTNFARVLAYFGWLIGDYHDKEKMAQYTLIASVVLFILSTASILMKPAKGNAAKKAQ